jgi:nucleoside-diphosphate-sugar epimerase
LPDSYEPQPGEDVDRLVIGCGYLGRRVANRWRTQTGRVIVTTRDQGRMDELRRAGFEPLCCDVLEPASLQKLPAVATVLYCVGLDRSSGRSMREVYVTGLEHVLAALPRPERFLYISSTSVYGQCAGEEVDETAATEPADESGRVVREAEKVLRDRLPAVVILRFAGIYGPGRLLRRRQAILAGEPLAGDPQRWLNLIHVDDGAAAILAAEQRGRPGEIYNICDDVPVRRSHFFNHLARLLGAPEPRVVPTAAGTVLSARERTNRRILNCKMHRELGIELTFPDYSAGLHHNLVAGGGK